MIASIGLAITFASLLGAIKPRSSGMEVPLTTVQKLAKRHDIATAVLLDHDSRVERDDHGGAPLVAAERRPGRAGGQGSARRPAPGGGGLQQLWAAYPASGAQTQQLAAELSSERGDR